jgi:hypothetical protein
MSSIWSLDGNDIYVDKDQEQHPAQVAELNPINSTTSIFHSLFEPTETKEISGTVVGEATMNALMGTTNSTVSLISDLVPGGENVFVQRINYERLMMYKQSIDDLQSDDAPVYRVSATVRPQ